MDPEYLHIFFEWLDSSDLGRIVALIIVGVPTFVLLVCALNWNRKRVLSTWIIFSACLFGVVQYFEIKRITRMQLAGIAATCGVFATWAAMHMIQKLKKGYEENRRRQRSQGI
jgi:hypothetical protein